VPPPPNISLSLTEGDKVDCQISVPQLSVHDTYRTLGVRISPSGATQQSFKVLFAKAHDYQAKIITSKLPREAALLSYNMYLLPKLGYPLPALTFSEIECQRLQSPTLAAFLPKIQLNSHIARSIVFGSTRFGGLGIRSLYSIQSLGQLTLFTGHLRAYDKSSKLLHISLSYLQLSVGSATNVLILPSSIYHRWTDSIWLSSLWAFLSKVKLHISVSNHWIPELSRHHDVVLMDYFVAEEFSASALGTLNRCWLYLQVITLADIFSADGTCIIPDVLQGIPLQDRRSTLFWPCQQRPPKSAWDIWMSALRSLQPKNRLTQPLGEWISTNLNQDWFWYKDCSLPNLYYKHPSTSQWAIYKGTQNPRRRTRASLCTIFDTTTSTTAMHLPHHVSPATVSMDCYSGLMSAISGPPDLVLYRNATLTLCQ
jgi:hypothetical protein